MGREVSGTYCANVLMVSACLRTTFLLFYFANVRHFLNTTKFIFQDIYFQSVILYILVFFLDFFAIKPCIFPPPAPRIRRTMCANGGCMWQVLVVVVFVVGAVLNLVACSLHGTMCGAGYVTGCGAVAGGAQWVALAMGTGGGLQGAGMLPTRHHW